MTPTPPDKQETRDRELAEKIVSEWHVWNGVHSHTVVRTKLRDVVTSHLSTERLAHEKEVEGLKKEILRLSELCGLDITERKDMDAYDRR